MTVFSAVLTVSMMGLALLITGCSESPSNLGAGGDGGDSSSSGPGSGPFVHGCLSGEDLCDGKCVRVEDNAAHCGACNNACAAGPDGPGSCSNGKCVYTCNGALVEDPTNCKNFFGAHESYPAECAGCSTPNPLTGSCSCPSPSSELSLAVQSDCPGVPMRSATKLRLCATTSLPSTSDFGGAYQVDDAPGWCGANAQCRVGNPLAGGGCARPSGFDPIAVRSIIRLPCDNGEVGTQIIFCGNKNVPLKTFGGVFQVDDLEPKCRVANPWTGGCSCPANTTEQVFRVMVDGPGGLYGSTLRMCLP
ncbi:MAG: hypothetical protein IPM54_20355 [Polyangiaceae bacterium]|nr:hypothetical protein [Polyangiaceae bacterium]